MGLIFRDKTINQKMDWLTERPQLAVYFISAFHPLKRSILTKYEGILDWVAITLNEKITWDIDLLRRFKEHLQVAGRAYDMEYDDLVLECSMNPTIPWSNELIALFEEDVNAEFLAQNPLFTTNRTLVEKYIPDQILKSYCSNISTAKVDQENEPGVEILNNVWLRSNKGPLRIKEIPLENWDISIITLAQYHLDWNVLSESRRIAWSHELIVAFLLQWNLEALCRNDTVPFTLELLNLISKKRPDFKDFFRPQEYIWNEAFGDLSYSDIKTILKSIRRF
jgi:hypothetical protein